MIELAVDRAAQPAAASGRRQREIAPVAPDLARGGVVVGGALIGMLASRKVEPTLVRVGKPDRGDLAEYVSARAEVEPKAKLSISARVAARIAGLPVEEGDEVGKGEVVVRLDAADLEAALLSAEANRAARAVQIEVERARLASQRASQRGTEASLVQARLDLKRRQTLLASRDVSQADVDAFCCHVDELAAQLDAAKHSLRAGELNLQVLQHYLEAADADIARARDSLAYTTISSTMDGTITRIHAEEGEMVIPGTMNNPGTVIMEIADLSHMLLVAQVDETDVGKVEVGQRAVAQIYASPDGEFEGTVDSIALKHDIGQGGVKYFRTEILLNLDGRRVYSGSTADVDIEAARHTGVLKVPSQAVLERPVDDLPLEVREGNPDVDTDKTFATVVYRLVDGKAVVTPVTIGASDKTDTVIVSGLAETADVIVGPYKVLEGIAHEQQVKDEREAKAEKEESEARQDKSESPAEA